MAEACFQQGSYGGTKISQGDKEMYHWRMRGIIII